MRKFILIRLLIYVILLSLPFNIAAALDVSNNEKKAQIAEVSIKSSMRELSDYRPGFIYIIVKNLTDSLLTVNKIEIAAYPEFLKISPSCPDAKIMEPVKDKKPETINFFQQTFIYPDSIGILPAASGTYGVYVTAINQLRPGNHMLLFNVFLAKKTDSQNGKHGQSIITSIPVSHEFKVNAYGENEILGALQNAVTFLILPGFIILIIAGLTWPWFVPEPYKKSYPEWLGNAKKEDLRFWVVAITLSLVMVVGLYPLVMKRNFLYGYCFRDIVWMWELSIGTGIFITATGWIYTYIKIKRSRWEIRADDHPEILLGKVVHVNKNCTSWFEIVTLKASPNLQGFMIPKEKPEDDSVWLIPYVEVIFEKDATPSEGEFEMLSGDNSVTLKDFLKKIEEEKSSSKIGFGIQSVNWYSPSMENFIKNPMLVKEGEWEKGTKEQTVFSPKMAT